MILENENVIFVGAGNVIYTMKEQQSMATGFKQKTIVVTSERILFFQSLTNVVEKYQYELVTKKSSSKKKETIQQPQRHRVSINSFSEYYCSSADRQVKIMINQQKSCAQYLQNNKILNIFKSLIGTVVLKNHQKYKFQLINFKVLKDGFRFCKAVICSKAWIYYKDFCTQVGMPINKLWYRILIQVVNSQKSIVLIDPDLFIDGSECQIQSFMILIKKIPFAHIFQHRYLIINQESAHYCRRFIQSFQNQTYSLIFSQIKLKSQNFSNIFNNLSLKQLMHLDLQKNLLNDQIFNYLSQVFKTCKKLSNINLSHNKIKLVQMNPLNEILKMTSLRIVISLSHNLITDQVVQNIEKYILFAIGVPIKQIDLSFNLFSKKGAWRLFVGNFKTRGNHEYMNFIINPIPLRKQIFLFNGDIMQFPKLLPQTNFNLHSVLIEEFQQQSFLRQSLNASSSSNQATITLIRSTPLSIKVPSTKNEVNQILQLSNKIQNFIYSNETVQKIAKMGEEMKNCKLVIPPITLQRLTQFINNKLNQALFIRDHFSVRYLLYTMKLLQIDLKGYQDRLNRLDSRNQLVKETVTNIVNFNVSQDKINNLLDEMVREGLRLYLEGEGIITVYYLKHMRDAHINKLIKNSFNPLFEINQILGRKNELGMENVSQKHLVVPYEIKVESTLNQNFYLHPWNVNYILLSELKKETYAQTLKFIQKSEKRQKFMPFFERVQQRIQFITNEFNSSLFKYSKFKATYFDLKLNCCRLIYHYRNITETHLYNQIPKYVRRKQITKQIYVTINNKERFIRQYHISRYPNIKLEAKKANFYNYSSIITRYESEQFFREVKELLPQINEFLFIISKKSTIQNGKYYTIEDQTHRKVDFYDKLSQQILKIINIIRKSMYPQELKEQFYLHLIGWRRGKNSNNSEVMAILPFLTMYLKPPLPLEKFIISAILTNDPLSLKDFPLSIQTNPNVETNEDELAVDYVERDWIPQPKYLKQLIIKNGHITIQIHLLNKKFTTLQIPESMTIKEIVVIALKEKQVRVSDSSSFWLYKQFKGNIMPVALTGEDHIGQVMNQSSSTEWIFLLKRRIYAPQYKYIISLLDKMTISSLYYDIRFEYLKQQFFMDDKNAINNASIIIIVQIFQQANQQNMANLNKFLKDINNRYNSYFPKSYFKRIISPLDDIISQLKGKISQKILKNQHNQISELKTEFLLKFAHKPEFASNNYIFKAKERQEIIKVSINSIYILIDSPRETQKIFMEQIISIIPTNKYLSISYHKRDIFINKIALFANETQIIASAMDILSYAILRLRMPNSHLYMISRYQKMHLERIQQNNRKLKQSKQLQQKLKYMPHTIIDIENYIYAKNSNYIKSYGNRNLYQNKADKKPQIRQQIEQFNNEQAQDIVFNLTFPHAKKQQQPAFTKLQKYNSPMSLQSQIPILLPIKKQTKKVQDIKQDNKPSNFQEPFAHENKQVKILNQIFQKTQKKKQYDVDNLNEDLEHIREDGYSSASKSQKPVKIEDQDIITNEKQRKRPPPRRRQ